MNKQPFYIILIVLGMLISCKDDSSEETGNGLDDEFAVELLEAHNKYRTAVGIANLEWSEEIAASAQQWADELLADGCNFEHSDSPYGENLWAGTSGAFTLTDAVDSWGSEVENYNYANNSCSSVCGHYTQIVWEDSESLGCGMVTCDGRDILVCQYDPPGNFIGQRPY